MSTVATRRPGHPNHNAGESRQARLVAMFRYQCEPTARSHRPERRE